MKKNLLILLKTPLTYIFIFLYVSATLIKSKYVEVVGADPIFGFVLFGIVLTTFVYLITKGIIKNQISIKQKRKEAIISVIYFFSWLALFMILGKQILSNQHLSNWGGFWGLLVLLPGIYLVKKGYNLSSFGISKKHFAQNLKVAILTCLVIGAILLFITPGGKYILNNSLGLNTLMISFCISFAYAFLFAGFFEEFFFRVIVQTRLSQHFESNIKGIILASIMFGLYHLPFQYYNDGGASGNFVFSLSNVLTEQMIAAPIFGILWARTQNIFAPVMLHSLIDAISLMPQMIEKYNL